MTKIIQSIMLSVMALALTFTFSSCSDDDDNASNVIWDFNGIVLFLDVHDTSGNSVLTSDAPGSIVGDVMTLDYKDKEYTLDWTILGYRLPEIPDSRYCPAYFQGLMYFPVYETVDGKSIATDDRIIRIGELPRDENYEASMVLHYNDYNHIITVKNNIEWIRRPKDSQYPEYAKYVPVVTTVVTFDGRIIEYPYQIVIIK